MKLSELKSVVKEAVKEAIQEEMKDILLEAVKSPQPVISASPAPQSTPMSEDNRLAMRENIQNVLGNMMPDANGTIKATSSNVPMQVTSTNTASPDSQLPTGEVDMGQIMNLMKGKV
tara:strand:+ start:256 stop:606 length:351 start_codon:yes stop_codon:yes gene_type:complete